MSLEHIDFQSYLEAIASTYEKWWTLYTLTDAEGRQPESKDAPPIFDFGLMVQAVKDKEHEQQQQEEESEQEKQQKIEHFPVLEGIRTYAEQHVLLVGRPGSGKSTALARLLLEEATTNSTRIPVLVELRYWQGSLLDLIHGSMTRYDSALKAVPLDSLIANALLLFDGVNELPSEEARSQLASFRRSYPKLPMIFTTRDLGLGGDLGIDKKLEMQPLTETQMEEFIRAYVPEQADAMLRQLGDRILTPENALIAPWSERLHYKTKRNGYHGGVSPQEMVIPITVLSPVEATPKKWVHVLNGAPSWWHPIVKVDKTGSQVIDSEEEHNTFADFGPLFQ